MRTMRPAAPPAPPTTRRRCPRRPRRSRPETCTCFWIRWPWIGRAADPAAIDARPAAEVSIITTALRLEIATAADAAWCIATGASLKRSICPDTGITAKRPRFVTVASRYSKMRPLRLKAGSSIRRPPNTKTMTTFSTIRTYQQKVLNAPQPNFPTLSGLLFPNNISSDLLQCDLYSM